MKKKIIYNEKRKIFWVQNLKWATAHLSRRLGAGQAQGARGACVGSARARWARAGSHGRRAWALGVSRRQACVGARAGAGRRQQHASAAGAWACAAGGAQASWACAAGGRRRSGRERQVRRGRAGRWA